ncbi:response regulator [Thermosulfurimonas marina]|uniref:Response regulator n=1 Tax=Thermosulfurimonas marina TaxID=2047767 RepID=A0A6H1WQF7_9BACT|nr:response regulator [Thermosulfurimonas marina]QJA05432.1 response regulator [Thermosulfurimonas marina]
MKILLVDDEVLLGETLKELLVTLGYEVLYTSHPKEAKEILKERAQEIGLAIIDVILPEISGPELARWIKETYPHIKVICITGYTPMVEPEPCGAGVPVLFKPFSLSDLRPHLL